MESHRDLKISTLHTTVTTQLDNPGITQVDRMDEDFIILSLVDKPKDEVKTAQLTPEQLQHLIALAKHNSAQTLFRADEVLPYDVYKFGTNKFVVCGKELGSGFWGKVNLASLYILDEGVNVEQVASRKCVLKRPKAENMIGGFFNRAFNLNEKMVEEASFAKTIHGVGESLSYINPNGQLETAILLPFLGKISLDALLKRKDLTQAISITMWVRIFILMCLRLDEIHSHGKVHNDIKPENVGLTIKDCRNGFELTQINFYDLGNALKINETGFGGDPKFQPIEGLCPLLPKTVNVDISALGQTILYAIDVLEQYFPERTARSTLAKCKEIAKQMCAFRPCDRLPLGQVVEAFDRIHDSIKENSFQDQLTK